MSNKFDERISALMDDELKDFDQELEQLKQDEALQQRWMRYHLIRDAVSGHLPQTLIPDLALSVSKAVENEPTILAPQRRRSRQIAKQAAGLAIAATVSAIAILGVQNNSVTEQPVTQLASAPAPSAKIKPLELAEKRYKTKAAAQLASGQAVESQTLNLNRRQSPAHSTTVVESKLNGYLVNHHEYSISAQMPGMLPYMRIVSVTPNEPVVIRSVDEK